MEGTETFGADLLLAFFTAFGVVLGASMIGSLATLFVGGSPLETMFKLAHSLKLWAVVVAMGGTFPAIRAIDSGIWGGEFATVVRQALLMLAGLAGAQLGYWIVTLIVGGES